MIETNNSSSIYDDTQDVAIIGIGLRLPGNNNRPNELWDNLVNGFDGIVETSDRWSDTFNSTGEILSNQAGLVELEEWSYFDSLHFGINPAEAKQIDPQQRLLLKCTWEALEDAGIDPIKLKSSYTSVFVGASTSDYSVSNTEYFEKTNYNIFNSSLGSIANRISYCFDFRGPSLTIDTACSSSLNACLLGYKSIISGECNYSIVSGCNFILNPHISKAFSTINIIGKSGRCKVFDESADGFVRSEGVAVLILKKLSLAINDGDQIYSIIRGGNSNVDGTLNKGNFMKPSANAQTNNIIKAFESTNGKLQYSDIDFFEVHGTGTPIGDPIEVEAVANIFKTIKSNDNPLLIGSIKSNIGHLEPASGVASLSKICLMFKHRQFIKNIHFEKPNPEIKFDEWNIKVCTENTPFPNNKQVSIAINSFGITGSNVCLLLSEYQNNNLSLSNSTTSSSLTTSNKQSTKKYLIPISANSKKSLDQFKDDLMLNSYQYSNSMTFNDFVYNQIYSKYTSLVQRSVYFASSWEDISYDTKFISTTETISGNIVKSVNNSEGASNNINQDNSTLVYVFCGQGPQWSGMGVELYNNGEAVFKKSMDQIDGIFLKLFGYSILSKLRSIQDDDKITINEPILAQPSIFMIQISLFELYKHWGIKPDIIVGHSFGEISAAYCSGMIDLETACQIIYQRSTVQNKTIGSGKMLAIGLNESQFIEQFSSNYPSIEICCFNSPSSIVVCSANEKELIEISQKLNENKVFSVLLGSPSAFHSSKQDIIKEDILNSESLKSINSNKSTIPIFSTVTGELFNDSQLINPQYIFENIRKPVLFQLAIENIFKYIEKNNYNKRIQFLELSPHPTLLNYIKEMIPNNSDYFESNSIYTLQSLSKKTNSDINDINTTISQLYCNGYTNVDFKCQLTEPTLQEKIQSKKASYYLPRYKWDDDIYFHQTSTIQSYKSNGPAFNQLGNRNDLSPFISYTSYIDIGTEPFKFLKGHSAKSKTLFPGCGYLDNLLKLFNGQDITINSLEFKSPLILIEGLKQSISTNIYSSGRSEYRALFHYKDLKSNKWILAAQARFSIAKHNSIPSLINVNKCKEYCNWLKLNREEIYDAIKNKAHLNLTGPFQSIEEGCFGNNAAFLKISLNPPLSKYDNQTFFNICILDACFQSLSVFKDHQSLTFFDRIMNCQFYSENIPKSAIDRDKINYVYCYTELVDIVADSYIAKIVMMLEDGTVLFTSPFVVYTAINHSTNGYTIENPNHALYSVIKQSKDSQLDLPSSKLLNRFNEIIKPISSSPRDIKNSFILNLYSTLRNKYQDTITPEIIKQDSIELLISKFFKGCTESDSTSKKNLSKLYFEILKINNNLLVNQPQQPILIDQQDIEVLNNLSEQLLNESVDQAASNNLSIFKLPEIKQNQIIKEIINNSIKPILNEPILFRILEIGSGIGLLSEIVINEIDLLLKQNPLSEVNIEFTFTDKESTFASFIKDQLESILESSPTNPSLKYLFKTIDLSQDLLDQSFYPSYFDMIIFNNNLLSNDINTINNHNNKSIIKNIYQILYPNGYLIIIDTSFKPITTDREFEIYNQWLSYNCFDSKLTIDQWKDLLINRENEELFKFKELISTSSQPYIITVQKPKIMESVSTSTSTTVENISSFDQIIIFGNSIDNIDESKLLTAIKSINKEVYRIGTYEEFEKQVVEIKPLTEKSIILFVSTINDLNETNYQEITFDYIRINQHLLKTKNNGCKHILLTKYSQFECINAFSSSILGAFRYFCEFGQELNIYSFDFDLNIYDKSLNDLKLYLDLLNPKKHIQREFVIRDPENNIYYERIKQEINLKLKYKSTSYINDKNQLLAKLDGQSLEFKLQAKKKELMGNEIEVQVKATGINFKDNLIYRGLVPKEATNHTGNYNDPEMGFECSGIVTRVGGKVNQFKIGDQVVGLCFSSASSHVVSEQDRFVLKPSNISFAEAASIPLVYLTSYFSLFIQGNLNIDKDETVLIHSASGGIGLAAIELLKAMGFKSLLFVTVGSKDKEQYLRNTYGSFITGIYSSRNTNYVGEIKKKIIEIKGGSGTRLGNTRSIFSDIGLDLLSDCGIDLIINTLGIEFMESNFNSLSQGGRIVDLSVTHLQNNETTDYSKFKYFIGYSTVEIMSSGFRKAKPYLQVIVDMIKNEKLHLIPIKEFPVEKIKDSIEFIGERKHIGKIIVNLQTVPDLVENVIEKSNNDFDKNYLIPSPTYQLDNSRFGKTVLISGQRGLSLTIIKWLLLNNSKQDNEKIKNIIVFSQSNLRYELTIVIETAKSLNLQVNFYYKQVDVTIKEQIDQAIDQIYKENPNLEPIESLFHNTFTPVQSDPLDVDLKQIKDSHSTKINGAMNLYQSIGFRGWLLKCVVFASSVSSILGGHRQCGYVCANLVINSFTKVLRQFGIPCISINFSAIGQNGYVARNDAVEALFNSQGLQLLSSNSVLGSLDLILQNTEQLNDKIIAQFNYSNIGKTFKDNLLLYKLDYFLNSIYFGNSSYNNDDEVSIRDQIINKFSEFLSIEPSKINLDIKLVDYGLDSILVVELKKWLDQTYVPNILTISQLQQVTINQLAIAVKNAVGKSNNKNIIKKKQQSQNPNQSIDWENEIKLNELFISPTDDQIKQFKESLNVENNIALLTGATGFFGIYLLFDLISSNNYKLVYCLVRNKDKEESLKTIFQSLKDHQLFKKLNQDQLNKIQTIQGDISKEHFGLSKEDYSLLSNQVNIVINSAFDTNLKKKYSEMGESLEGVNQCLKFSTSIKLKKFIQISTLGIYTSSKSTQPNDDYYFPSIDKESMESPFMNGYLQAKIVSEYRIKEASSKHNMPTMILRLPFLFPNPDTGIGRPLDLLQIFLQTCYIMDAYPLEIILHNLYTVPINWASKNVSFVASNYLNTSNSTPPNGFENLTCLNLFAESIPIGSIIQSLGTDLTWRPITSLQFIRKLSIYENETCKLLSSFLNQQDILRNIIIPGQFNLNETLKKQLVSNNTYNNWEITKKDIITHLSYTFKKKIL